MALSQASVETLQTLDKAMFRVVLLRGSRDFVTRAIDEVTTVFMTYNSKQGTSDSAYYVPSSDS